MKKILIIGCGGSGKSTFAKELNKILSIELVHLDKYFWKTSWIEPDKNEWNEIIDNLLKKTEWIMDGNYNSTLDKRIEESDTIFYFDLSTLKCLLNVVIRILKCRIFKIKRDDVTEDCNERFDPGFFTWIINFRRSHRKQYLEILDNIEDKKVIIFTNHKQVKNFLLNINKTLSKET